MEMINNEQLPKVADYTTTIMRKAKPFIKWVGGKTQLISQLDGLLPYDFEQWDNVTYIEPFVGGGAMLFYMLQRYPNIRQAVINDINTDLITCYITVRDHPEELILYLRDIQDTYYALQTEEGKKNFFLAVRSKYNEKKLDPIENTTMFFFLNRTCFNGLYRVNKKGLFNVPFGKYKNPRISNQETIIADSRALNSIDIDIINDSFETTKKYIDSNGLTFFYFDPPYRPLTETSSFTSYSKGDFNDDDQIRLAEFCKSIDSNKCLWMLSNSDGKSKNPDDDFFDNLYDGFSINRVSASRSINANPNKRGKLTELLIHNKYKLNNFLFEAV